MCHSVTQSIPWPIIKLQQLAAQEKTQTQNLLESAENMHTRTHNVLTKERQPFDNISNKVHHCLDQKKVSYFLRHYLGVVTICVTVIITDKLVTIHQIVFGYELSP